MRDDLEHCSLFKPKLPTGDTGLFSSPSLCTHGEPRTTDPCLEHALTYAATTDQLDGSFDCTHDACDHLAVAEQAADVAVAAREQ